MDKSCNQDDADDQIHLLGHCGVDLSTCQVDVLVNLGLEGEKDGREGERRSGKRILT